ncbi:MAG: prealbumin-like fold domain-containing protein [Firmicutes bacterium]|nr:prealbumin-like fold domain-containing protein [Bacillota bacterium]
MKKRLISWALALVLVLGLAVPAMAATFGDAGFLGKGDKPVASLSGQTAVKKYGLEGVTQAVDKKGVVTSQTAQIGALIDGEYDTLPIVYSGTSSANHGYKVSANKSYNEIMLGGEVVGFFVFDKGGNDPNNAGNLIITLVKDVIVGVRWDCSKYYGYAKLEGIGVYSLPQLMQDNGKTQSFDQIWILTVEPIIVENPVSLKFTKLVEGEPFAVWAESNGYDPAFIAAMMSFELYKANDDGTAYLPPCLATAQPDLSKSGFVFEYEFTTGWYAIVEVLTAEGQKLFDRPDPLYIYIKAFEKVPVITESTGGESSGLAVIDFDYEAFYTIANGYNYPGRRNLEYGVNGEYLNNNGDLFYIGVTNINTGVEYPSFCAHAGSKLFAGDNGICGGYVVPEKFDESESEVNESNYADFVSAFNYIEDKYGNLNENRAIVQVIVWALLGAIDVESDAFAATTLSADEKAAIIDVMINYKGYIGEGKIGDVVYMVCEKHHNGEHDFEFCQPQLVPVYAKTVLFKNKLIHEGGVRFNKTMYGGRINFEKFSEARNNPVVFKFDLYMFDAEAGDYVYVATYASDSKGTVEINGLKIGKYMVKEVIALVFEVAIGFDSDGNPIESYNLVWKACYPGGKDALYFEIDAKGDTVWDVNAEDLDKDGNPTIDNVIYAKHHALWATDGYDPYLNLFIEGGFEVIDLGEGKGKIIIFNDWCHGALEIIDIVPPTCTTPGIIWLGCTEDGCSGLRLEYCLPLEGHGYTVPVGIVTEFGEGWVWFACPNGCGGEARYDMDAYEALIAIYKAGAVAIAIAPGYGDGYVWFSNTETGYSFVTYDYDAWIALGGNDFLAEI